MKNIKKEKRSGGFTLIELLVVIAIIGILSSIVLASLNNARVKARDAKRLSDIKQIQLALELYADAHGGSYPTTIYASTNPNPIAPYLAASPTDPVNATHYHYASFGTANACYGYHLGASLEQSNPTIMGGAKGQNSGTQGTTCPSSPPDSLDASGADFGSGTGSTCLSGDAGTYCYDVTN
jgi:prepilin-type N-terminal cleavage/methylation domain-containing protein